MRGSLPLRPILSSLARHRLTAALIALEVACTFAIVCNVIFLIAGRVQQMEIPSGLIENELSIIDSVSIDDHEDRLVRHQEDLVTLAAIPGVTAVAAVDALPLSRHNWSNGVKTDADSDSGISASAFDAAPGEIHTLGLRLLEGRDFQNDEFLPANSSGGWTGIESVPVAIISHSLAEKLFPGQSALGKSIYLAGAHPTRIVGVVDHLLRPSLDQPGTYEDSTLFPMLPDESRVTYVLRSAPQNREAVLKSAAEVLQGLSNNRITRHPETFEALRNRYFERDRTMIGLLFSACGGLLFVTALGIAGLASFWVQGRTRQIGVRRALGARRVDVILYFQMENFLIVTLGIALGMTAAYGLNLSLMNWYEIPRLPLFYLPIGALSLWFLGQVAVLGPAFRAARVPPVVATRSV